MEALRKLMVGINVTVIVLGSFALFGCRLLRNESEWLREQLRAKNAPPA